MNNFKYSTFTMTLIFVRRMPQFEGILIYMFNNIKGFIPKWLEILDFSLRVFLVKVNPCLVSNIEFMIFLVLVISRIMLLMYFFKILLHFQVYLLDPFHKYVFLHFFSLHPCFFIFFPYIMSKDQRVR
jgi:hypothetical protein